jgi:hypothetical protein
MLGAGPGSLPFGSLPMKRLRGLEGFGFGAQR